MSGIILETERLSLLEVTADDLDRKRSGATIRAHAIQGRSTKSVAVSKLPVPAQAVLPLAV